MDVRIGIKDSPRELAFESNQSAAEIEQIVAGAVDGPAELVVQSDRRAAIEQAIAGNRLRRRSLATLANGHGSSP